MNWLNKSLGDTKIAAAIDVNNVLDHVAKAVAASIPGQWSVLEVRPNLKKTYFLQHYGVISLRGEGVYDPEDEYLVKVFFHVKRNTTPKSPGWDLEFPPEEADRITEEETVPLSSFESAVGHSLVYFHALVQGYSPQRSWSNQYEEGFSPNLSELGNTRPMNENGSEPPQTRLETPAEVAEWVLDTINKAHQNFDDDSEDDGGDDSDRPIAPVTPSNVVAPVVASVSELAQRFNNAQQQSRQIQRTPRKATVYYDSLVEDAQVNQAASQPWKELLQWMQQNPQPDTEQYQHQVEYYAKDAEPPNPADYEGFDTEILEFYIDNGDMQRLKQTMDEHDISYDTIEAPSGKKILTIEVGTNKNYGGQEVPDLWVVEQYKEGFTKWDSAEEWIDDAAENPEEYYPEQNKSTEFWDGVGPGSVLYHATPDENADTILQTGLEAREDTQGLDNKDMGPAVFTISPEHTDSPHATLESHGDTIISIDLASMKADGYMPEIAGEAPVEEAETKNALANLIGYDFYEAEHAQDYMPDTIAIYGDVPAKYLSVLHQAAASNWLFRYSQMDEMVEADPEEVGYDPKWGEYHRKVKYKPDPWNYGPQGCSSPPMPMPKKLYHATPYPDKILSEGFKTPKELGQQTFGGGEEFMSFTSLGNAKKYQEVIKDLVRIANGEFDETSLEDAFRYFAEKWGGTESDRLDGLINMVSYWQKDRKERGKQHDTRRGLVDFFGYAHNHGIDVPYLFGGNEKIIQNLESMTPEQIGILEVETRPELNWHSGANTWPDTDMSQNYTYNRHENEWRVYDPTMIHPLRRVASTNSAELKTASAGPLIAYHATMAGSKIMSEGFKTSKETGERAALGGSDYRGSISFTTDWPVALAIHNGFVLMHQFANSPNSLADAKQLISTVDDSVKSCMMKAHGGDEASFEYLLEGWKAKSGGAFGLMSTDELAEKGFRPHPTSPPIEGTDKHYVWLEPMSQEDIDYFIYSVIKYYLACNPDIYDPLFFGGDITHFRGVDRNDIGIVTAELHIDPEQRRDRGSAEPGFDYLSGMAEIQISDKSMIRQVLDFEPNPGGQPSIASEPTAYHADPDTEQIIRQVLQVLYKHYDVLNSMFSADTVTMLFRMAKDKYRAWEVANELRKKMDAIFAYDAARYKAFMKMDEETEAGFKAQTPEVQKRIMEESDVDQLDQFIWDLWSDDTVYEEWHQRMQAAGIRNPDNWRRDILRWKEDQLRWNPKYQEALKEAQKWNKFVTDDNVEALVEIDKALNQAMGKEASNIWQYKLGQNEPQGATADLDAAVAIFLSLRSAGDSESDTAEWWRIAGASVKGLRNELNEGS